MEQIPRILLVAILEEANSKNICSTFMLQVLIIRQMRHSIGRMLKYLEELKKSLKKKAFSRENLMLMKLHYFGRYDVSKTVK